MLIQCLILIFGFFLLIKGADWLVDGASSLARIFGISDLIIGLTIVAIGTSTPELFTDTLAAFNGNTGLVVGDIVGSNIANILLIGGVAAIITPLTIHSKMIWREIPFACLAAIMVFLLGNDLFLNSHTSSYLSRWDGIILLAFFGLYLFYISKIARGNTAEFKKPEIPNIQNPKKAIMFVVGGLITLVLGAKGVVSAAIFIAHTFHISEVVIGLTVVALGTSLPELAVSIVAARQKKSDIIIGNIVGSNICNIFFILGLCAIIRPLPLYVENNFEIGMAVIASVLLLVIPLMGKTKTINRLAGGGFLILYLFYIIKLVSRTFPG